MSGDVQLEIVADRPQAGASSGAGASLGDITAETTDSGGSGSPIPVVQAVVPAPPQVSAPTDPPAPKSTFDEPASPPPAYGAASAPRPLQMDRANFDSKDFQVQATHFQFGVRRMRSSEAEPESTEPMGPVKQISGEASVGILRPRIGVGPVEGDSELILGRAQPLTRLGRIALFAVLATTVFGLWSIDLIVDNKEYCAVPPPPAAPPAAPARSVEQAAALCSALAAERGDVFSWGDGPAGAAGVPAGCISVEGGAEVVGDAASGDAAGGRVVFRAACAAPPAGCTACANCTACAAAGCAVLRTLDELLGGADGGGGAWVCPDERERQSGIKRMLAFVVYSAVAFATAFLLLTRKRFDTRWTLLLWLPRDAQLVLSTITLGFGWPLVLPVLLRKLKAVDNFLRQAEHRPGSWPYDSCVGRAIRAQQRRRQAAAAYRARRAEARRLRAEGRERRRQQRLEEARRRREEAAAASDGTKRREGPCCDDCCRDCYWYCDGDCCFWCCWAGSDCDCCFSCYGAWCEACCDGVELLIGAWVEVVTLPYRLCSSLAEADLCPHVPSLDYDCVDCGNCGGGGDGCDGCTCDGCTCECDCDCAC